MNNAMWYLTRGSGAVALVLLTASMCLGIASSIRWRGPRFLRFTVAALHRNLTLLAVVFLGVHIVTAVADSYAPIGWKDAVVPFLSPYRPLWLGVGALACDLVIALVVTSLLRARIGVRAWRLTHWLAYACWPLAFVHSLGTGSDPRTGWFQVLAAVSLGSVLLAVGFRLARARGDGGRRLALGAAAAAVALLAVVWYRGGPGAPGWAARAGTPSSLRQSTSTVGILNPVRALPSQFTARLDGTVTESQAADGLVDVHLDGAVAGGLHGRVRVVLRGFALDGGGVSMTASGVAFAARGSALYQGAIVGLDGTQVAARLSDGSGHTLDLSLDLQLSRSSDALTGTVRGRLV
jgi:hypothetical protein